MILDFLTALIRPWRGKGIARAPHCAHGLAWAQVVLTQYYDPDTLHLEKVPDSEPAVDTAGALRK